MQEKDLPTVLRWRNSDRVREASFTDHEVTWHEHVAWFERASRDDTIRAMVFDCGNDPTGVVNFTRIDREAGSGVWGFYIGRRGARRGSGTTMGLLALDYAFADLGLRTIISEAFVSNRASVRYHRRLGFREVDGGRRTLRKKGRMQEVMRLELDAERWKEVRASVLARSFAEDER